MPARPGAKSDIEPRPPRSGLHTAARDGVAWWTIDCRGGGGRLSAATAQELVRACEETCLDDHVAVVVLCSAGSDFCLGFEEERDGQGLDCVAAVAALPQAVVAVIRGRAVDEGAELALACDMRLAGRGASLALTQIGRGRLPRHGGTQRLPRLVGEGRALDLLWSGRPLRAAEAERIGLVSRIAPDAQLRAAALGLARELRRKGPLALRLAKEAVRQAGDLTLDQGMRLEHDLYVLLQTTADRAEGVRAFCARRTPRFRGR